MVLKIISTPIEVIYDSISSADTQATAWELLAPGGQLIVVLRPEVDQEKPENKLKKVVSVLGNAQIPINREIGKSLFSNLTKLLEDGLIKVRFWIQVCSQLHYSLCLLCIAEQN